MVNVTGTDICTFNFSVVLFLSTESAFLCFQTTKIHLRLSESSGLRRISSM